MFGMQIQKFVNFGSEPLLIGANFVLFSLLSIISSFNHQNFSFHCYQSWSSFSEGGFMFYQ